MLSVFCYIALISICYITLLNLLKNKFTTCFSGEKVLKTPVLLKTAIQFRKRNGVHDFTYTTSLGCKNRYIITKEFYNKQRNQTVIFVSLKRFPQPAKMLHMSLQCEFFLKASLQYLAKRNILLLTIDSRLQRQAVIVCTSVEPRFYDIPMEQ